MRLPKDYAAPRQEETAIEYIWERKGCVQQQRESIVRCRDCKYCMAYAAAAYCDYMAHAIDTELNGFCAWAERKEATR